MQPASGNILANILSGMLRVVTHGVYGILRIIYRRDMRWMALYAGLILAIVLLLKWAL